MSPTWIPAGLLPSRCQRRDLIAPHSVVERVRERVSGGLGVRAAGRGLLARSPEKPRLGAPSRYAEGAWVRVLDETRLRATLDARDRLRGLWFVPAQWAYCGGVFRVQRVVRRMLDDHGAMRPIARTVLLDGITCAGPTGDAGCGRHCPMMFRDEWVEPAQAPGEVASPASLGTMRIRSEREIRATLDVFHKRDGVRFMGEMGALAGRVVEIAARVGRVYELDAWHPLAIDAYLLRGLACTGAALGSDGPCDRACPFVWHADWLERIT